MDPLVALIVARPGLADRLLAEHGNDGTGHCRACSTGAQAGRYVWPCAICLAATAANRVRQAGEQE